MPRSLLGPGPSILLKCELRETSPPSSSKSEAQALREISETIRRPTAFCSVEIVSRGLGESVNRLPTGGV